MDDPSIPPRLLRAAALTHRGMLSAATAVLGTMPFPQRMTGRGAVPIDAMSSFGMAGAVIMIRAVRNSSHAFHGYARMVFGAQEDPPLQWSEQHLAAANHYVRSRTLLRRIYWLQAWLHTAPFVVSLLAPGPQHPLSRIRTEMASWWRCMSDHQGPRTYQVQWQCILPLLDARQPFSFINLMWVGELVTHRMWTLLYAPNVANGVPYSGDMTQAPRMLPLAGLLNDGACDVDDRSDADALRFVMKRDLPKGAQLRHCYFGSLCLEDQIVTFGAHKPNAPQCPAAKLARGIDE